MDEVWLPVVGYEAFYEVSNLGRVKKLRRMQNFGKRPIEFPELILRQFVKPNGYTRVILSVDDKPKDMYVHRLVATCFCEKPIEASKLVVNHKNGIKNDNRAENLEWCTYSANSRHAYATGLHVMTEATKKKLSDVKKGIPKSEEGKANMRKAMALRDFSYCRKGKEHPSYKGDICCVETGQYKSTLAEMSTLYNISGTSIIKSIKTGKSVISHTTKKRFTFTRSF